jgi:hypothetical protein
MGTPPRMLCNLAACDSPALSWSPCGYILVALCKLIGMQTEPSSALEDTAIICRSAGCCSITESPGMVCVHGAACSPSAVLDPCCLRCSASAATICCLRSHHRGRPLTDFTDLHQLAVQRLESSRGKPIMAVSLLPLAASATSCISH